MSMNEPVPTPMQNCEYELGTIYYDYKVHPDAQKRINLAIENLTKDLSKDIDRWAIGRMHFAPRVFALLLKVPFKGSKEGEDIADCIDRIADMAIANKRRTIK